MVEDWYIYCKQVQAAKPVRQKEVADMLSMISYAEENGIKKGEKKGENRLGTLMNMIEKYIADKITSLCEKRDISKYRLSQFFQEGNSENLTEKQKEVLRV